MTSRFSGDAGVIDLVELAAGLEPRLVKGSALLFEMEQAGERDARYARWVTNYARMAEDYDLLTKRIILRGQTSIDAIAPPPPTPEPDAEQTPLLLGEASLTSDHLAGLKDRIA